MAKDDKKEGTAISAKLVKELRDRTNAGMMACKGALQEAGGDIDKAETILRKKGIEKAEKKASREASEGIVESYIHMAGRVGVLVEVNCETDFVAKNENFRSFVKEICLHICAASPMVVSREEMPQDNVAAEKEIYADQMRNQGKPENIIEKIVEGKLDKFYSQHCLLEQAYIKDQDITVGDLLKSKISELGENIVIRRFTRYAIGEA